MAEEATQNDTARQARDPRHKALRILGLNEAPAPSEPKRVPGLRENTMASSVSTPSPISESPFTSPASTRNRSRSMGKSTSSKVKDGFRSLFTSLSHKPDTAMSSKPSEAMDTEHSHRQRMRQHHPEEKRASSQGEDELPPEPADSSCTVHLDLAESFRNTSVSVRPSSEPSGTSLLAPYHPTHHRASPSDASSEVSRPDHKRLRPPEQNSRAYEGSRISATYSEQSGQSVEGATKVETVHILG